MALPLYARVVARAAVVIVNYRTPDLTERCIRAVATDPAVDELVVVDNASADGSVERFRSLGIPVIERSANDGFAAGVNAGFAATTAPYVVLLNPDAEPRPGAIALLAAHLENTAACGVAAPRLVLADGSPQPNAYRRFPGPWLLALELCAPLGYALERVPRLDPYRLPPGHDDAAHVSGAALAIRRSAYLDAGAFDEGFFLYLEETEWQQRVRRAGWSVDVVPSAYVAHDVRGGGEAAESPSPHFVLAAVHYLELQGHSRRTAKTALGAGILASRLGLRAIALMSPRARDRSRRKAHAYDELWQTLRSE
jgi:GT2 family glycosyltransferase